LFVKEKIQIREYRCVLAVRTAFPATESWTRKWDRIRGKARFSGPNSHLSFLQGKVSLNASAINIAYT